MRAGWGIFGCVAVVALIAACSQPPPEPTPDLEATVQAAIASALQAETPPTASIPVPSPPPTAAPTPTLTPTPTPSPTATPTPVPLPTATPVPPPPFRLTRLATLTSSPSQVQFVFSLRDQEGRAIVLPVEEVKSAIRVYERAPGRGGWDEIDYSETGFFVHTAESFGLEVVFVLDFTNSMAQARLPDGKSGIEAMIGAFESAVLALPGSHRIGVIEFHDRNVEPRVLSELTTDRDSVLANVRRFEQGVFDHGSSRIWDSVVRDP